MQKIIDSPQPGYGFVERLKKKQIDLIERVMFEYSEK